MAKFKSQVYTIIRGSVGGITYTATRNQQLVARARTSPVQPLTQAQQDARSAWAGAEAEWRNASLLERQQWQLYADLVLYQGPLGSYTLTGRQRFLGTLQLASYLNTVFGESITMDASAPVRAGWFLTSRHTLGAPAAPGTGFQLTVYNDEPVDAVALVNVSQPVPGTRNFWKGPWDDSQTFVFDLSLTSSNVVDITGLIDGEKYFVRIRAIGDAADHRFSEPVIISGLAETTVV